MLRKVALIVLTLLALLFWYMTLTVPVASATAPLLIAVGLSAAVYLIWSKRNKASA